MSVLYLLAASGAKLLELVERRKEVRGVQIDGRAAPFKHCRDLAVRLAGPACESKIGALDCLDGPRFVFDNMRQGATLAIEARQLHDGLKHLANTTIEN